ncbi:MAG: carboxypeptidase regulatory-like domain-containing protein [Armatimonadota bacterium]
MRRYLAVFAVIISFCTPSSSAVKGTVVNKDGKPIAKAMLYGIDYSIGNRSIKYKIQADKNGRFNMPGKTDNIYIVVVADGYAYNIGNNVNSKGELKITLWPDHKVKGRIVDTDGKPMSGVKVAIKNFNAFTHGSNSFESINYYTDDTPDIGTIVTTGKDGVFELSHIPDGDDMEYMHVTISASKPGYALVNPSFDNKELSSGLQITVPKECIIEGTLYQPDKSAPALEGSRLTIQITTQNGRSTESETRDASVGKDGKFRFDQLPPSKAVIGLMPILFPTGKAINYQDIMTLDWVLPAVTGLELKPDAPLNLELVGVRGVNIKGVVVDKATEKPISNAEIMILDPSRNESLYGYDNTNEKGEFNALVAPGECKISVYRYKAGDEYVSYHEDYPSTSFTAVAGEDKSDIVVKVTPPENNENYEQFSLADEKPIPQDLKLIPGTYTLAWNPDFNCSNGRYYIPVYLSTMASAKIKKLPDLKSKNPGYQIFKFDGAGNDGLLALVIDESKGTGKGYDTAYIDQNRNMDLSDDTPITWDGIDRDFSRNTEFVTVQSHQGKPGEEQTQHPVKIRLRVQKFDNSIDTFIESKGTWTGTIDTNKGKIKFAAIDSNNNGIFGETANPSQPEEPDAAYADLNNVGMISLYYDSKHSLALNEVTGVAGSYYKIHISSLGDKVTVEPYEGKLGKVLVSGKNINGLKASANSISLTGKPGMFKFDDCNGSALTVPAGKYRLTECGLVLDSKMLKSPKISCTSNMNIDVKPDQQVNLEIGGKLTTSLCPDRKELVFQPGNSENITWEINIDNKTSISSLGDLDPNENVCVKFFNEKKELVQTVKAGYT